MTKIGYFEHFFQPRNIKNWSKVSLFEAEKQKLVDENIDVSDETSNSKLMVIKDEIDFIKKVMAVVKDFKG